MEQNVQSRKMAGFWGTNPFCFGLRASTGLLKESADATPAKEFLPYQWATFLQIAFRTQPTF